MHESDMSPCGRTDRTTPNIRELLTRLREGLQDLYGERLRGVFLFGSYARGEADPESDVDVLIVLDHVTHYAAEVDHTGALVSTLSLAYGVSVSRVFVAEAAWACGRTTFLANARAEALAA